MKVKNYALYTAQIANADMLKVMKLSSLIDLCIRATETKGILHKATIETLRNYIRQTPEEELLRVIFSMNKPIHLRALWEAGVSQTLQLAIIKRLEELK